MTEKKVFGDCSLGFSVFIHQCDYNLAPHLFLKIEAIAASEVFQSHKYQTLGESDVAYLFRTLVIWPKIFWKKKKLFAT